LDFSGYRTGTISWEGQGVVTYAGSRIGDAAPLLLCEYRGALPGTDECARVQRDYEISQGLAPDVAIRPIDLVRTPDGAILVLEDEGFRPLRLLLHDTRLALERVLELTARAAKALEVVHSHRLIHKNLSDETVWVHVQTGAVKLSGFSVASRTPHRGHQAVGRIEGSLPFVAPEQTGRMNRSIDHRADHYSLGVIAYLALTGKLPFESRDPLELIHCHLARRPRPPHLLDPRIPTAVSAIVMKALAKAPEDRYQRARGLGLDFEACLCEWQAKGSIDGVRPGERDSVEAFQVPQVLYGRDQEQSALMRAFARTSQGASELLLVSGDPGIGKSALVNEIHKPIVRSRGYFISGKFDQYRRNIPYSAIVQAFQDLVAQILSEPADRIQVWKARLLESLGARGQVVIDVIPEIAMITGPQPPLPELPITESRNRFVRVFRDFIRVFTHQEHPLAVFLDDLQWADSASLALIQFVLTDPATQHLLLIGAYRDNEVDAAHPLLLTVERVREAVTTSDLVLSGLDASHIKSIVTDTFRVSPELAAGLADLVYQKTGGNPFFVNQFLRFLLSERLVEAGADGWTWDLAKIRERGITDSVVEFMSNKLAKLPAETQAVLRYAACIGNSFDLGTLRLVTGQAQVALGAALRQALVEGLVLTPADGYHLADDPLSSELPDGVVLRFLHDRVQQSAYALISEAERPALHLRIGELLRSTLSPSALEESLFVVVNHLNAGVLLVSGASARRDLAALNLTAARKARESAAYSGAIEYLKVGLRLLPEDSWSTEYRLTCDIHTEWMECEYHVGHPEEADSLFQVLLSKVTQKLERAKIHYTKILVATNRNRNEEAIALGLHALEPFRIRLPAKPSAARLMREVAEVTLRLRGRDADSLLNRPELKDTEARWAMRLLVSICPAAYFAEPNLMTLAALRIVNMTLQHGNAPESPYGYILYALVLGAVFGNYERGHAFGRLAVAMSSRDEDVLLRCKVLFIFAGLVNVWARPVDDSIEALKQAYQLSLDVGDIQYATYSLQFLMQLMIFRGVPLERILEECERHRVFTHQTKDVITIKTLEFRRQIALGLRGATASGWELTSAGFDEATEVQNARSSGNLTSIAYYLIPKLGVTYLFGQHELAAKIGSDSERSLQGVLGQVLETDHRFYVGVNAVALARRGVGKLSDHSAVLKKSIRKFRKWSSIQPDNFEQQLLILEAEAYALAGDDGPAMRAYDAAIDAAKKHRMLHFEALANELAGQFHMSQRREHVGRAYIVQAMELYTRWGALAKVRQLSNATGLVAPVPPAAGPSEMTERVGADLLDLDAIMQANQAIAGEVEMESLLDKLIQIVLQNAGAQSGCVVLEENGELRVEASDSIDGRDVSYPRSVPVNEYHDAFAPVINYVARTRKDLVIDDARIDTRFEASAYVIERGLKSVLCCPVVKQGRFFGVLYMENNLTTGAFTPGRIQTLRMIASEVASAVENVRLYGQLKSNNRALQQALEKVDLLEKAKSHLAQFVPQSVRRIIDENPTAPELAKQDRDVSILFLDIEGYTTLSERLDLVRVDYLIERYFSSFLDDIHTNGGDINETAGDGLMIIFQHEDPNEHAICAARTALAILAKTADINRDLSERYEPVRVNIGINSGVASVGSSRFQGITGARYTYTASGPVTNLASRLGSKATEGAVLVSEETARRIAREFAVQDLGGHALKNIAVPVRVFRLLGAASATNP
jgi:predicted ATPase/class 3 adenylate cyclase/GAF domain-containing protein